MTTDLPVSLDSVAVGNMIVATETYSNPNRYHDLLARLRAEQPVFYAKPDGYQPFWMITRHADIREVELNAANFINAPRLVLRSDALNAHISKLTGGRPFMFLNLTNMDGAQHNAFRKMTHAWFLPARVKKLEEEIRGHARTYIDRMLAMGDKCDFVRDVAVWYPLRVIMTILGVPPEDEPRMLMLTQQLFGPDDPEIKGELQGDLIETINSFFEYFRAIIADRRANPTDDVATVIAQAEVDGRPLTEQEILSYYILIATAGHDTTSSTTGGGMHALAQHPEQYAMLRADPSLLPKAIDEMLRWVTPVTHFFRTAVEDVVVGGQEIKAGESLLMCYPSANRDEAVFSDPFRFDITRSPNPHLAFGYGPHLCLGQHLAKLEIRVFFEEFLKRVEKIELAGEPAWLAANFVGGLKRMPMSFQAAG